MHRLKIKTREIISSIQILKNDWLHELSFALLGPSINHVVRCLVFFDPPFPIVNAVFHLVIWSTPSPSSVHVVYGYPIYLLYLIWACANLKYPSIFSRRTVARTTGLIKILLINPLSMNMPKFSVTRLVHFELVFPKISSFKKILAI